MLYYNQKEGNKPEEKEIKIMKKIIEKYNEWMLNDFIYKAWESEDEENVMIYENIAGDVICIEHDENGEIIDAWEE